MSQVEYRYELKYVISDGVAEMLKKQLRAVMELDSHSVCEDYSYIIRSLYFDDYNSSAFAEKVNGEEYRRKYRIRMYNFDDSLIRLFPEPLWIHGFVYAAIIAAVLAGIILLISLKASQKIGVAGKKEKSF